MKLLKISSIFLTTLLLFSSCSQPEKKDSIDVPQTEAETETESTSSNGESNTDTSTPVSTGFDIEEFWDVHPPGLSKVNDYPTEYNGEELSVTIKIENSQAATDYTLLLFVNGERNDYSTDEYPEKKAFHIYELPEKTDTEVTLHFTPYNCKKGEKAIVNIEGMFAPNFMHKDMSYLSFGFYHWLLFQWPFEIIINQDAPESEYNKISSDFESIEMTEEYAKEQGYIYNVDGQAHNSLDSGSFNFKMYQKDNLESYMVAKDKLTLTITAAGSAEKESGKHLVGIYINHELQKAFGDNYYALCDVDSEHETRITANIDVSKLSGLNHIYMIAAPYNPDDAEFGASPYKTETRFLLVGDESELPAYSLPEDIPHP